MISTEMSCHTSDGLELAGRIWRPDAIRGVVALVHGLGEHCGRYQALAEQFAAAGLALVTADLRGHGCSPGEECYVRQFDDYLCDARAILMQARELAQGKPLFLMGHSMGGAVSLHLLDRLPEWRGVLAGAVFSSPAFKVGDGIPPPLVRFLRFVAVFAPRLRVKRLDPTLISRDPAVVTAYIADPLVRHRAPPLATLLGLLQVFHSCTEAARHVRLPTLMFHGDADGLTAVDGTRQIFANWAGTDKTLRIWPGGYHELLNDLDAPAVSAELVTWLGEHC